MNETLENIMVFINENTNILIGICLFLIFVLIGYLIDNSIKTRKYKKEAKNNTISSDQVNVKEENTITPDIKTNNNDKSIDIISTENSKKIDYSIDLDKAVNDELNRINSISNNENTNTLEDLTVDNILTDSSLDNNEKIEGNIQVETIPLDDISTETDEIQPKDNNVITPDILNDINNYKVSDSLNDDKVQNNSLDNVDVAYKNDKKLSEILFDNSKSQGLDNSSPSNIFDNDDKKNPIDISKEPTSVEIEEKNTELDKIMKKLENVNNLNPIDDDYTNIF